jgi:shikimate kinase
VDQPLEGPLRSVAGVIKVVVLRGPPGSGKSTIGEELGRRGLRWREWESVILERWGSRERFVEHKAEALPELHKEMLTWIASDGAIAVIETTGLSDALLISALRGSGEALVVRLDVSEEEALRRVAVRQQGRHLNDELADNRAVWRACQEQADRRDVDLIVDTEVVAVQSAVAAIISALGSFAR